VKFERTDHFKSDYKRLKDAHKAEFRAAISDFHAGAVRAAAGEDKPWPNSMRVKGVQGAPGIWETTWSMSDPDGGATWEWIEIDGEAAVLWRRLGDHSIFKNP
jgi:hypothetical protein